MSIAPRDTVGRRPFADDFCFLRDPAAGRRKAVHARRLPIAAQGD